jgi:hypothetical protein
MRAWCCVLLGLTTLAMEASASERFSLSWAAPDSCPGASEVELEIERALARVDSGPPVHVIAKVTAGEGADAGFALHVVVQHDGESSERTLTVSECAEVARATALFVALAVQSAPSEPSVEAEAPAPTATAPEPTLPPATEPANPPPQVAPVARASSFGISLGPQAAMGFGPSTEIGVGVGLALHREFVRALVRGSSFLSSERTVEGTSLGGNFSLLSAAAFGCLGPTLSDVALWTCFGAKLNHLRAEGFGTDADESRSTTIFAGAVALELEWRLPRGIFLLAGVEGGYAPETARFVIDNLGLVHETEHVFGEARIELGASF